MLIFRVYICVPVLLLAVSCLPLHPSGILGGSPLECLRLVCLLALLRLAFLVFSGCVACLAPSPPSSSGSFEFLPTMTAATAQTVQYLNLAYFGRPADPASQAAFPTTGMTDEEIVLPSWRRVSIIILLFPAVSLIPPVVAPSISPVLSIPSISVSSAVMPRPLR